MYGTLRSLSLHVQNTLCKIGGFLDLRPWKLEGNMVSNLIENLGKRNDTASLPSFQAVSSDFPRFPTRLLPTGFRGRKSRKPLILHSDTSLLEFCGLSTHD